MIPPLPYKVWHLRTGAGSLQAASSKDPPWLWREKTPDKVILRTLANYVSDL